MAKVKKLLGLKSIGKAVRARRIKLGMSQNQLAKLSGVQRHSVLRLEHGKHDMYFYNIVRIARVVGIEIILEETNGE